MLVDALYSFDVGFHVTRDSYKIHMANLSGCCKINFPLTSAVNNVLELLLLLLWEIDLFSSFDMLDFISDFQFKSSVSVMWNLCAVNGVCMVQLNSPLVEKKGATVKPAELQRQR